MRLHYVYPYPHVDDVIPLMADGKVLPYLDVPFQHASPAVLKRMRRPAAQEETLSRIQRMARHLPEPHHPLDLYRRLSRRDRSRIFRCCSIGSARPSSIGSAASATSRSPGAAANDLAAPVPDAVKEERWKRLMELQQEISAKRLKRKVGGRERVIIDEISPPGSGPGTAKGRSKGDAPQIDGSVFVHSRRPLRVGEIATVKIERADAYDLHGSVVGY